LGPSWRSSLPLPQRCSCGPPRGVGCGAADNNGYRIGVMSTIDPAADPRHTTLRALCDTVVPSIARDDDPDGFWARSATDLGVDLAALEFMATMPDAQREGLGLLLDALTALNLAATEDQASREAIVRGVAQSSPEAGIGMAGLVALVQFLHYGLPDPA